MSYAVFISLTGTDDLAGAVGERLESNIIPALRQKGQVNCVSLFTSVPGQEDPYGKDETPAQFMIQIDLDDLNYIKPLFDDGDLMDALRKSATCEAYRALSYPVDGATAPAPRTAPVSFNVRYYAPVDDEKQFVEIYLQRHPPILAELPGVRNVLCYVPVAWTNPTALPVSNCILGNEVVFDSMNALNDALASEVRHRLRDDYNDFPVRPGPNTHFAMTRRDFRMD